MITRYSQSFINYFKSNYVRIIIALVIVFALHLTIKYLKTPDDAITFNYPSYTNYNFSAFGLNIPRNLSFCGEKIPTNDYALRDNLEKEFFKNKQWKRSAGHLYSKAQKWFPYIEPILKQEGVPDDFKYVAVIESHLSNARSSQGAAGFWQLVPATARNYGLVVNDNVDERLDVEKSTRVACKLIKDAYKTFNNWTLSAAAYNLGIGGIQRALAQQNSNNYYDLMLNKETGSFVYRLLAYKTLFSDPKHFGVKRKTMKYLPKIPVKIIKIDTAISDISQFAKAIKCNTAIVKLFNPWLLNDYLDNPNGHTFEFKIPKKLNADYSNYYADLLEQKKEEDNEPIDSLSSINDETTNEIKAEDGVEILHNFSEGEKLKEIAEIYGVTVVKILNWNNLKSEKDIQPGQLLTIRTKKEIKSEKQE